MHGYRIGVVQIIESSTSQAMLGPVEESDHVAVRLDGDHLAQAAVGEIPPAVVAQKDHRLAGDEARWSCRASERAGRHKSGSERDRRAA